MNIKTTEMTDEAWGERLYQVLEQIRLKLKEPTPRTMLSATFARLVCGVSFTMLRKWALGRSRPGPASVDHILHYVGAMVAAHVLSEEDLENLREALGVVDDN